MATRKRLRLETPHRDGSEAPAMTTLTETLQAVIQEVRLLRVEQARREEEYTATIRRQEEELRRLRGTNSGDIPQLSLFNNSASGDAETRAAGCTRARDAREGHATVAGANENDVRACERSATASAQSANGQGVRACERSVTASEQSANGERARAACGGGAYAGSASESGMRPTGRSVNTGGVSENVTRRVERGTGANAGSDLDVYSSARSANAEMTCGSCPQSEFAFKLKLDMYEDDSVSLREFLSLFRIVAFLLIARAYRWDDATKSVALAASLRGKIACSQFVTAVTDHSIRQTLQMEGITFLNLAIERAKAVRIIQGKDFEREGENFARNFEKEDRKGARKEGKGKEREEIVHFRSECPDRGNAV